MIDVKNIHYKTAVLTCDLCYRAFSHFDGQYTPPQDLFEKASQKGWVAFTINHKELGETGIHLCGECGGKAWRLAEGLPE